MSTDLVTEPGMNGTAMHGGNAMAMDVGKGKEGRRADCALAREGRTWRSGRRGGWVGRSMRRSMGAGLKKTLKGLKTTRRRKRSMATRVLPMTSTTPRRHKDDRPTRQPVRKIGKKE
jgi:hypothetical protein